MGTYLHFHIFVESKMSFAPKISTCTYFLLHMYVGFVGACHINNAYVQDVVGS